MADEIMTNETVEMAEATDATIQATESGSKGFGLGRVAKVGLAILGGSAVAGVGFKVGSKIVDWAVEKAEISAAGRKADKEARAAKKAEIDAKKKEEAEKDKIPTSEEGEKVLDETK